VFKFQHDVLTRALEGTGPLGRAGFRYSSVFSFAKISLVRPQPKARASNLRAQTAPAVLEKINFQITSVPADGSSAAGGKLRHVPVSWAAIWQAAACQYHSICGTEIKAQGRVENSIRVGSVGRSYFETRWPQFVPPAKVMWQ
jgi:hypothetical protein